MLTLWHVCIEFRASLLSDLLQYSDAVGLVVNIDHANIDISLLAEMHAS